MKVERAGDLIFQTYFMVDWKTAKQTPSEHRCMQCGGQLQWVEPVKDSKGLVYDGLVCHTCRQILWVKKE